MDRAGIIESSGSPESERKALAVRQHGRIERIGFDLMDGGVIISPSDHGSDRHGQD
jgi:hypothetical protein